MPGRRLAYTLVELLVVVSIIGLLIALLMPAVSGAWEAAKMTKCQTNLAQIYKAECSWRAEKKASSFTRGTGWQRELLPYVDRQDAIFICPCSPGLGIGAEYSLQTSQFEFVIYTIPGIVSPGYTPYEAYPITIPLDGSSMFAAKVAETDEYTEWHVDDGEHKVVGGGGGDDIQFRIYYEHGVPTWVQTMPGSSGSRNEYRYEFYMDGVLLTNDWYNQYARDSRRLELLDFCGGGSSRSDYGLSVGTFLGLSGAVSQVDPRLILMLDYPKILADYNDKVDDNDAWDEFFIDEERLDEWLRKYRSELEEVEGLTWQDFQALRHYGQANVLFCDGSVRPLTADELEVNNGLWYYGQN